MADTPKYNTLFVVLPNKETLTVRKLSDCVTLEYVKAKLELLTGIHGNAIQLRYGEVFLDDDFELRFGNNIKNAALIRLILSDNLLELYLGVCETKIQTLTHECIEVEEGEAEPGDSESDVFLTSKDKRFFCSLVACSRGNLKVIQSLFNSDTEGRWKKQCTQFGRTLAHVAVASDHTTILGLLLEYGAPMQTEDCFHNKPQDIATIHSAYTCERMIKQSFLRKKPVSWQQLPVKSAAKSTENTTEHSKIKLFRLLPQHSGISGRSLASPRRVSARTQPTTPHTPQQPRTSSASKLPGSSKSRVESSESKHKHEDATSAKTCIHKNCSSRPPFMAFRSVAQEELRPVSVEYVPLDTFTYQERQQRLQSKSTDQQHGQQDYPKAPCSSLNNSTEDLSVQSEKERLLERRNEIMRRYSKVKGTSCRAQSAKYYRTTYHMEMDIDSSIPKPRPATAGPRYREWKIWLLEKMAMEEENEKNKEMEAERRQMNDSAFKKWLSDHKHRDTGHSCSDDDESNEDEDGENEKAYQDWLGSKQKTFEEMDKKRKEQKKNNADDGQSFQRNRKITIFELGSNSDQPVEPPKPDHYMRAFQTWKHTKRNYENWRKRKGLPPQKKNFSKEELIQSRDVLLMQGMTYNEWLGLKARQDHKSKLNIHNL